MSRIKSTLAGNETVSSSPFSAADVWDEINHLDSSKTLRGDILVKILKMTSAFCFSEVAEIASAMLESGLFPNILKRLMSPLFSKTWENIKLTNFFDQ